MAKEININVKLDKNNITKELDEIHIPVYINEKRRERDFVYKIN